MNTLRFKNRASYDRIAPLYAVRNAEMPTAVLESAQRFIKHISSGACILDAGCGTGRDGAWFVSQGFLVTAFDLSAGMLHEAGKLLRSPRIQGDMLHLPFHPHTFDALWCSAALLHVPKVQVQACLSGFRRVLKEEGVVSLALQAGSGEVWEPVSYGMTAPRFFARYSCAEIEKLIEAAGFQLLDQVDLNQSEFASWLHYFARVT